MVVYDFELDYFDIMGPLELVTQRYNELVHIMRGRKNEGAEVHLMLVKVCKELLMDSRNGLRLFGVKTNEMHNKN